MTNENVLVAGNQVSMLAGGTGIDCVDSLAGLARGNLVQGATTAMNACADLGGNEVLP